MRCRHMTVLRAIGTGTFLNLIMDPGVCEDDVCRECRTHPRNAESFRKLVIPAHAGIHYDFTLKAPALAESKTGLRVRSVDNRTIDDRA